MPVDLKCMQCSAYVDLTNQLECPNCHNNTLVLPVKEVLETLIQLQKANYQLLDRLTHEVMKLRADHDRLHDEINDLINEQDRELPETVN